MSSVQGTSAYHTERLQKLVTDDHFKSRSTGTSNVIKDGSKWKTTLKIDEYIWAFIKHLNWNDFKHRCDDFAVNISAVNDGSLMLVGLTGPEKEKTILAEQDLLMLHNQALDNCSTTFLEYVTSMTTAKLLDRFCIQYSEYCFVTDDSKHSVVIIGPTHGIDEVKQKLEEALSASGDVVESPQYDKLETSSSELLAEKKMETNGTHAQSLSSLKNRTERLDGERLHVVESPKSSHSPKIGESTANSTTPLNPNQPNFEAMVSDRIVHHPNQCVSVLKEGRAKNGVSASIDTRDGRKTESKPIHDNMGASGYITPRSPTSRKSTSKNHKENENTLKAIPTDKTEFENNSSSPKEAIEKDCANFEQCPICMERLRGPKRLFCGHIFCKECIESWSRDKPVCPVCGDVYGKLSGNQPDGEMLVTRNEQVLPGFERSNGTIIITYIFPSGTQKEGHPFPNQPYQGTRRRAYLPDCPEGNDVLDLLKKAFDAKLTFTIGQSVTTGEINQVIWNDIHHKTSTSGGSAHYGYPDVGYLSRVKEELAAKGIR